MALVQRFHWILYAFGVFLIWTGFQLMRGGDEEQDPSHNIVLKFCRRFLPLTDSYEGKNFFVRREGRDLATPLFVVLLVVETTDILFATDSIPAILAITRDPFIVYTSNVFAILGLRSMYFALGRHDEAVPLPELWTVSGLNIYRGQDVVAGEYHVPTWAALAVVAGVLGLSVLASVLFPEKRQPNSEERQA